MNYIADALAQMHCRDSAQSEQHATVQEMEYEDILDRHFAAIIQLSSIEDALVSYAKHIDDTEAEKIKKVTKDIEILRELIDLMLHDTRLLVRQASALKY